MGKHSRGLPNNISWVNTAISAVIAEIESITTIKQEQEEALAPFLRKKYIYVFFRLDLALRMFCYADWLKEMFVKVRTPASMLATRGPD